MIVILDYGMGNLKSIHNMFKKIGVSSKISSDINDIKNATKYILPGVGAFDYGMKNLEKTPFFDTLEKEVLKNKKPILGICLGMQLLTNGSQEGNEKGLGWIDAEVLRFDFEDKSLPVPHMGWNRVSPVDKKNLFRDLEENRFYFVHSYYVTCNDEKTVLATANYGTKFVCSINKDNIFGVQFHPEKSHKFGMRLLKNFGDM